MGLTAPTRVPSWVDATTQVSTDLRLNLTSVHLSGLGGSSSAPLAIGSGVRQGTGNPLLVAASGALSVTVNTGICAIQGTAAANAGAYTVALDTVATLTCTAADPTNPRMDSVCITADAQVVQIITGTPAASPSAPSLPANSLLLANITVRAGASSLLGTDIADVRQFLAGPGGIKPFLKSSLWPAAANSVSSDYLHDIATGRMKRWSGSAWVAPSVVAFAPAFGPSATVTASGTSQTVSSAPAVTVDGATSVKLRLTWSFFTTAGTAAGNGVQLSVARGGTTVGSIVKYCWGPDSQIDGGSVIFEDQTPAAGTYTYSFNIINQGAGTFQCHAGSITVQAMPS